MLGMDIVRRDFEKVGAFYLGKEYHVGEKKLGEELVLYESKDLVTHGVVLGMTGSGKTGLCMSLLEEAGMDEIPAIVIDPKGDIANLMLNFPELCATDLLEWVDPAEARAMGMSTKECAESKAKMWREGLAEWGQGLDRVRDLSERVDVNIFTPGSRAGIPVSILSSLACPNAAVCGDSELLAENVENTVASLLSLIGIEADEFEGCESVFLASLFHHRWSEGRGFTLETLIECIQEPPFERLGVLDLEDVFPSKSRRDLVIRFNNLLASPSFSVWLEGPALDISEFLYNDDGRARISVFSIAHLDESERMFFVSLLLNQMLAWMRGQGGTKSLRALLYMDEIYGYLPPVANPPSKKPLMTLLKQARAYGVGCLLATQNPVDLDYKALSNIGTWWLGRLQTERDKLRVLDGLSGIEAGFDRSAVERLLSSLDSRVFLMHNVHEDRPVVFHVRWVMSYLYGPVRREQIKKLMKDKRLCWLENGTGSNHSRTKADVSLVASLDSAERMKRPKVEVGEYFFHLDKDEGKYKPYLLCRSTVYFKHRKSTAEVSQNSIKAFPMKDLGVDWKDTRISSLEVPMLKSEPLPGIEFVDYPNYARKDNGFRILAGEYKEWIYRHQRTSLWYAPVLDCYSEIGEKEGSFRGRLAHRARESRDQAVDKVRAKVEARLRGKRDQLSRAQQALAREKAQAQHAKLQAGASLLGSLAGMIFGGRKSSRRSVNSTSRAIQQARDVAAACKRVEDILYLINEMESDLREDLVCLERSYDPRSLELEELIVKPYKKDIVVDVPQLLWVKSSG